MYSYRLDGLDKSWSEPSGNPIADYRNIPAGEYTFTARAIGISQQWSEPIAFTFSVTPPWWSSWYAYTLYTILGGTLIFWLYQYQLRRRLEHEEHKRLVEMDQLKNKLYTNITHEFRTPLTLIHGPIANALSQHTPLEVKEMESMYRQSNRLQQLITQMLDLQKIESGRMAVHYQQGDIVAYIRYVFEAFSSMAAGKDIALQFTAVPPSAWMDYDEEKINQNRAQYLLDDRHIRVEEIAP